MKVGDLIKTFDGDRGFVLQIDKRVVPSKILYYSIMNNLNLEQYSDEMEVISEVKK
jgi:hypothetical protein|tara:strand:- start:985 stop:1152 length:168 start_codon:yes stop_codon:yes gene_type:complete